VVFCVAVVEGAVDEGAALFDDWMRICVSPGRGEKRGRGRTGRSRLFLQLSSEMAEDLWDEDLTNPSENSRVEVESSDVTVEGVAEIACRLGVRRTGEAVVEGEVGEG
jgi:hypothetical protein